MTSVVQYFVTSETLKIRRALGTQLGRSCRLQDWESVMPHVVQQTTAISIVLV
jgi:hypothetical protein